MKMLVTGGTGFLGLSLRERLDIKGYKDNVGVGSSVDFRQYDQARELFSAVKPEVVIALAAFVGGIGLNRNNPGRMFYDNAMIGINTIHAAKECGVKKVIYVGTTCSYPKLNKIPFTEDSLWSGFPDESNAPYGVVKRSMGVMLDAYRQQYGLDGIMAVPANLYGPRDHFDDGVSHVIPALIKKFANAKAHGIEEIILWGDGSPTREFLHVRDCADGLIAIMESYKGYDPINIGGGDEVAISSIATMLADISGYTGKLMYDISKPNGQPRRQLDASKLASIGFKPSIKLYDGLIETYEWYIKHGNQEM